MSNSVGGTSTINSDDRLLLQVLDSDALSANGGRATGGGGGTGGSVSTADLLDLLERSVNDRDQQQLGVHKNGNNIVAASGHSDNDGSSARSNRRRGGGRGRLPSSESVNKLRSSFTSRLLGGQTDDDVEVPLTTSTNVTTNNMNINSLAIKKDHPRNNDHGLPPVASTDNLDGGGSVHSLDRSINLRTVPYVPYIADDFGMIPMTSGTNPRYHKRIPPSL